MPTPCVGVWMLQRHMYTKSRFFAHGFVINESMTLQMTVGGALEYQGFVSEGEFYDKQLGFSSNFSNQVAGWNLKR